MDLRIDVTIERQRAARAKLTLQYVERNPARIAEHEIEIDKTSLADVWNIVATAQACERNRRIEIIEYTSAASFGQHEIGRCNGVRTIGGDDRRLGIGKFGLRLEPHLVPFVVEHELAARQAEQVAVCRVVRGVALEEHNTM